MLKQERKIDNREDVYKSDEIDCQPKLRQNINFIATNDVMFN